MATRYLWSGLLLLTVVRWTPALVHMHQVGDESYYVVVATEMLGGARPYVEVVDRKPPLLYYTYEGILALVGQRDWPGLHALALTWTIATMVLLALAASVAFGKRAGLPAALFYGLCVPGFDYHDFSLNGEMMMNLPIAAALALSFQQRESRLRLELIPVGALLALAALFKQSGLLAAPAFGLYVLLSSGHTQGAARVRLVILRLTLLTAGFVAAMGTCALLLYHQGNLKAAIAWTLSYNDVTNYPTEAAFWLAGARGFGTFALVCAPLVALCALGLRTPARDPSSAAQSSPEHAALLGLLIMSVVGSSITGRFFSHYLIQLLPPMALLAAPIAADIWEGRRNYTWLSVRRLNFSLAIIAAALLVVHSIGLSRRRAPNEAALWIRAHSTSRDRILAWTVSPDFYLDANRHPASRFIGVYPLTGMQFGSPRRFDPTFDTTKRIVPGTWETLRRELQRSTPMFIVDQFSRLPAPVYRPQQFPVLRDLLAHHYRVVYDHSDAVIYQRVGSGQTGLRNERASFPIQG